VEKGKRAYRKTSVAEPLPRKLTPSVQQIKSADVEEMKAAEETVAPADTVEVTEKVTPKDLYSIQVASYKKEATAKKEATRLKDKGFDAQILLKGSHYIVCAGKFGTKEAASGKMPQLRSAYPDCYVRKL